MCHRIGDQDNLSKSENLGSSVESDRPADGTPPAQPHATDAEGKAAYQEFLNGRAPFPSLPGPLLADYPSVAREGLVIAAKKQIEKIKWKSKRTQDESIAEEEGRLLAFRPQPVPPERVRKLKELANNYFSSVIERGLVSHSTAIDLSWVRQQNVREFPQKALVLQARNECRAWLQCHGHSLADQESWLEAHCLLAQLTWWARGVGALRPYWRFVARDRSFGTKIMVTPKAEAFFGDRRFDATGIPHLLAKRGRFFALEYRRPEPWDQYLVRRLESVAMVDLIDLSPGQQELIQLWKREHDDLRPTKLPIAIAPEQLSDKCRFVGGVVSTKTAPAVALGTCVELLGLSGGSRAVTGQSAVAFLPALGAGPLWNEDRTMPAAGEGLWAAVIDIDEARDDKSRPLSLSNMNAVARKVLEVTWASGGCVERSQSGKGVRMVRAFEAKGAERLTRLTQENHIDGVKVEFFAEPPRVAAMTGLPIPGMDATHDPATAFSSFELDCPLGRWLLANLKVKADDRRRGGDDLAGLVLVTLEALPVAHRAGPWDHLSDADVYDSVLCSCRSYRHKVEAYQAEPGSVDASGAEWQLTHLLLDGTGENQQRTARILREFSPFLIGLSGKGRKAKLAGDYVVRTVLKAAIERNVNGAIPTGTIAGPAAGGAVPVKVDANAMESGGTAGETGDPTGQPPGSPGPPPANDDDSAPAPRNRATRREWLRLSLDPAAPRWTAEMLSGLDPATRRLFRRTASSTNLYQRPDLLRLHHADDCCRKCRRGANPLETGRIRFTARACRDGNAEIAADHFWCNKASCVSCCHQVRSEYSDLAAICFPKWGTTIHVYRVDEWDRNNSARVRRRAGGRYAWVKTGSTARLIFSAKPLQGFRLEAELSVEEAVHRFAAAIWSIPVGRWPDGIYAKGKLVDGGEEFEFGHAEVSTWGQDPTLLVCSALRTDISPPAFRQAVEEHRLHLEEMQGLQARSGNFFSSLRVFVPRNRARTWAELTDLFYLILNRSAEITREAYASVSEEIADGIRARCRRRR